MSDYKDTGLSERLSAAANAKRAAIERFRAKAGPNDPAAIERQAARRAISVARDARIGQRKAAREADAAAREADAARQAADQAARDAALQAELATRNLALEAERKAERKAARDIRYAARKARAGAAGRGAARGR